MLKLVLSCDNNTDEEVQLLSVFNDVLYLGDRELFGVKRWKRADSRNDEFSRFSAEPQMLFAAHWKQTSAGGGTRQTAGWVDCPELRTLVS